VLRSRCVTKVLVAVFRVSLARTGGYVVDRAGPPGRSHSISGPYTPRLAAVAWRVFLFRRTRGLDGTSPVGTTARQPQSIFREEPIAGVHDLGNQRQPRKQNEPAKADCLV